jgi:hypothetical protein
MEKLIRTTLITGLFFFGLLTGLQAQDKYDFIMTYVDPSKPIIHVIQNDVPEKIIDTGKKFTDGVGQYERLLSTVSQLTADGWEVVSISGYTFYLRKKK